MNYYLDSVNGLPDSDGNSPERAWKNLSQANEHIFEPGDTLLLKRGSVWNGECFSPKGSGTAQAPITVDAYGKGEQPVIDRKGGFSRTENVTNAFLLTNQSYWTIRHITVSNTNPNAPGEVEAAYIDEKKDAWFPSRNGLVVTAKYQPGVSETIVRGIVISECTGTNIDGTNGDEGNSYRWELNGGADGIRGHSGSVCIGAVVIDDPQGKYRAHIHGISIEGCTVYNGAGGGIRLDSMAWSYTDSYKDAVLRNNNLTADPSYNNSHAGMYIVGAENALIEHNRICHYANGQAYQNCHNGTSRYNFFYDLTGKLSETSKLAGRQTYWDAMGFDVDSGCYGEFHIYANVISNMKDCGFSAFNFDKIVQCHITVENNVFFNSDFFMHHQNGVGDYMFALKNNTFIRDRQNPYGKNSKIMLHMHNVAPAGTYSHTGNIYYCPGQEMVFDTVSSSYSGNLYFGESGGLPEAGFIVDDPQLIIPDMKELENYSYDGRIPGTLSFCDTEWFKAGSGMTSYGADFDVLRAGKGLNNERGTIQVTEVTLSDFNGSDALQKLRAAADFLRRTPGARLIVPPGVYELSDPEAVALQEAVMRGDFGCSPSDTLFQPYYPHCKGISLAGAKDVSIIANGVTLNVKGFMEVLSLENCQNVTVEGLTIDYVRKPFSEGDIINVADDYFDIRFDEQYPITEAAPTMRIMYVNKTNDRFYGGERWCGKKESLGSNTLRCYTEPMPGMAGQRAVVPHVFHFRPAILISEASNIHLENVTIHSQAGMGIVAQRGENIYIKGLSIVPSPGCHMSTNTDATNFANCKGDLVFENCRFEGSGDDFNSVHGYYYDVIGKDGGKYKCGNTSLEFSHAQTLDYPDAGDVLELTEKNTMRVVDTFTVKSVAFEEKGLYFTAEFDKELPEELSGFFFGNITRLPRLRFINNHCGTHRARSVLLKTRDAIIEGCTFADSTGPAIQVASEGSWQEGVTSADVIIRRNRFLRSGSGWGPAILVNIDCAGNPEGMHRNMTIEDNLIDRDEMSGGISISNAENVIVRNNTVRSAKEQIAINHCENVINENNHLIMVDTEDK